MHRITRILRVDSSARFIPSRSRKLTDRLVQQLARQYQHVMITERNIYEGLPQLNEKMVQAMGSAAGDPAADHLLQASNMLVQELMETDVLVLGVPIYNFAIPASLKAYIDLIARAGVTFRYGANGPEGLLTHLDAYVVVTSDGTPMGSNSDFVASYLQFMASFLGFRSIQFVDATQLRVKGEGAVLAGAEEQIRALTTAAPV